MRSHPRRLTVRHPCGIAYGSGERGSRIREEHEQRHTHPAPNGRPVGDSAVQSHLATQGICEPRLNGSESFFILAPHADRVR